MSSIVFETERLIARRWDPGRDAEAAFEMYGDPEVTKHLGGYTEPDVETMRRHLREKLERDARFGEPLGGFPLFEKSSGVLAGAVLLKPLPENDGPDYRYTSDIEVGWHLPRRTWGKGYATEAGRALLSRGFALLDVDRIHAVVDPDNPRSMAVARRVGMQPLGTTDRYYGKTLEHFAITREEHATFRV
jgi:RimJ/RimL family protein N-acetyltransferase